MSGLIYPDPNPDQELSAEVVQIFRLINTSWNSQRTAHAQTIHFLTAAV